MAAIPCPVGINCEGSDFPITNYSAEGPEQVPTYLALVFPESFDAAGCLSLCESTVSQQDADLCALAQAAACPPQNPIFPPTPDDPNPDIPVPPPAIVRFFNSEQSCTKPCPDGSEFTYTVPAGIFSASTQEAADARADAYACMAVGSKQICIGVLGASGTCVGSSYSDTIPVLVASGLTATVSISAGSLPSGITMTVVSITPTVTNIDFLGTPTTTGQYDFTILAQDAAGNMQSKSFSIYVRDIFQSTLPDGNVGHPYSQPLTISGPTTGTVTWSITAGALPPGLTLNPTTGVVSGQGTADGDFTFTATFADDNGTCSQQISMTMEGSCLGLSTEALWVYNPNNNPGQPPPEVSLSYTFEGYYGTWGAIRNGGAAAGTVVEWRTDWTSTAGKTLRVRATLIGSVTRGGAASTVICRANANGNQVTQSILCPANMTTDVNLDVTATDATLGGPAFVDINHQIPAQDTYSLTGEVFVECV